MVYRHRDRRDRRRGRAGPDLAASRHDSPVAGDPGAGRQARARSAWWALLLLLVVGTGLAAYNYMMHDNDFCRGLPHLRAQRPGLREARYRHLPAGEQGGRARTTASPATPATRSRSRRRPRSCSTGSPTGPTRCRRIPRCRGRPASNATSPASAKKTWQRIASTAGHRIHLESDSSALKDVACLTCHARTAHRFQPADTTCAQKGCHLTDEVKIRLGRMASPVQPRTSIPTRRSSYCNSCHQFTAEAQFVTLDSAGNTLRPAEGQCFGCHEMRELLATLRSGQGPHGGSCGMCHNPHTDVKPDGRP